MSVKYPKWVTQGKSIKQLIKELHTFDNQEQEVRISLDDGNTHKPISIVVKDGKYCILENSECTYDTNSTLQNLEKSKDDINHKNIYKKWGGEQDINGVLCFDELNLKGKSLRMWLKESNYPGRIMEIAFENVILHRHLDENDISDYSAKFSPPDIEGCGLFIVELSELIEWFNRLSCKRHEDTGINHYSLRTPSDCFDIITRVPPKIGWIS